MSQVIPSDDKPRVGSVERPEYRQKQTFAQLLRNDLGFLPVLLTLLIIAIYFTITTEGLFLQPRNISDLLQQIVNIGIDGLGVTFVLLLGEIDLSVAAVGTFGAVVTSVLAVRMHVDPYAAIGLGLLAGALAGFINGFIVAVLRVPSFIVTLAASIFYSGFLLNLLAGQSTLKVNDVDPLVALAGTPYSFLPDWLAFGLPTLLLVIYAAMEIYGWVQRRRLELRTKPLWVLVTQIAAAVIIVEGIVFVMESTPSPVKGLYLGIPNGVAIFFGLIYVFWAISTRTRFGRHIYAVGGNAEAARRAGINVTTLRIAAFTLCSTLAVLGGLLATSRSLGVASQINPTLQLNAIAAAVIGGVSLFGGRGSFWAVALGALVIGSLENGLSLRSQGTDIKQMVEGAVLVIAVIVDALVRRMQARQGR
uniref:Xylose transport system permease protein XylH n=1 Tax=Thermosporothrix sp. COM3 TaxID=2490863 RepID=A0A455SNF2_9CHLR|nr:ABC transporter permease [Thermosporothrix sp. COM3]